MQTIILPKLAPRDSLIERVARALAALSHETAWRLEIHEQKPRRSEQQNRYLWGCIYPYILKAGGNTLAGWEAEDLHEYFLGEHFGWEEMRGFGRKRMRPLRRSSRLNKQEFADYIDFIQRRMAEHGIVVPDADPNYFEADQAA